MINMSDAKSSFDQWFFIHLANLKSVKVVQKSVKSQGIFQLLMSGNAVITMCAIQSCESNYDNLLMFQ